MTRGTFPVTLLALLALALGAPDAPALASAGGASDTLATHAPLFTRRDLVYAGAATAAVAAVASQDRWATRQATAVHSRGAIDAARFAEHLGNAAVVAPALVATDLVARASGHAAFGAATERVALSVGVAGVGVLVLKEAVGRARPFESPDDPHDLQPFSGHDAFPSGHTTVAFALAGALGCESRARWLPWVSYPLASLVGWSRVRDDKHWASDVVAGAAFGWWTARKTEQVAKRRLPNGLWVVMFPERHGAQLRTGVRF